MGGEQRRRVCELCFGRALQPQQRHDRPLRSIVGWVPYFGLVTDEGRKATWKVYVKTSKKPEAQILGSAIGMKVTEDVPYVFGLDRFLGEELNEETCAYLKDFGAATASNGAVGLYHIDRLTPEAKELGESLITENAKEYIIDDEELERVYKSYPVMWKNKNAKPALCFIGCPHLTYGQLMDWTHTLSAALKETGRKKVKVRTVMTAAPRSCGKVPRGARIRAAHRDGREAFEHLPAHVYQQPRHQGESHPHQLE